MSRMDATSVCSPMARMPPAAICRVSSEGSRLAAPALSEGPKTSFTFSGTKKMGSQPSATSAVMATFFSPRAATQIGMRERTGWLISFRGLPRPVPSPAGSGIWYAAPPWVSGASRAQTSRQISMISRVRVRGRS